MTRVLGLLLGGALIVCGADYQLIIRNGRVLDGTGAPARSADIGVRDGRIVAVGAVPAEASADRTIDAAGRVVAPGFIDVHTHIELGIKEHPRGSNYLFDGVTTVVSGNCGNSETDLDAWFRGLEERGAGINIASLIGHNSVREAVMGRARRAATPAELQRMRQLVDAAMRAGAVGFSTGLIYIPGTYASTAEVKALATAAGRHGGVYATHLRDEGEKLGEAIAEAAAIGRASGMRVHLSHLKIDTGALWGGSPEILRKVNAFRTAGLPITADAYPYDRSSSSLDILVPSWAMEGSRSAIRQRFKSAVLRRRAVREMLAELRAKRRSDYSFATVAWAADERLQGKTIVEINAERGRPRTAAAQAETVLELAATGSIQMVYQSMSATDVETFLRDPNVAVASDGGVREPGAGRPHPRSYGTNARVLAEYVRMRGVLTLEEAVRRMTSLPARTFGLRDRGQIREGFAADLLVFDPERVQDKATYDDPHQYSAGFDYVIVNGTGAIDAGSANTALPGRILRRQR